MNRSTLAKAKAEAKRFLDQVRDLEKNSDPNDQYAFWSMPRHTGAVRRASMDLTRALADLRRPG